MKDSFQEKSGNKNTGHIHRGSYHYDDRKFNKKNRDAKHLIFRIGLIIFGLFLVGILAFGLTIAYFSIGLPDVHDLDKLSIPQSTTIYDRDGNAIYVEHGGENRQYVTYDQIAPLLVNATVSIEDDSYWQNPGFNFTRMLSAGVNDVLHLGAVQGASTITQQYIKNAFLTDEKSLGRKIQELILSVQLEQTFDKKKILELYLNKIPYGNSAYGIEKAAQLYFNKHAADLDLAQSATLASIPQAPSYYNPYGPHEFSTLTKEFSPADLTGRTIKSESDLHDDEFLRGLIGATVNVTDNVSVYLEGRSDLVLKRMFQLQYISQDQENAALKEIQQPDFIKPFQTPFLHQHFIFYILDQLEQKYGKDVAENGGLSIYTTLDPKLQDIAESVVKTGALANDKKYNDKNAALVAIDPTTGQILAMVGSRDYNDTAVDGNVNVATRYRQPGSSFKPFVYSQLFYNQYGPGTVVYDAAIKVGPDTPKNFDGKFWGPMTIRKALGQSRNIPAIKAYFLAGGQQPIIALAQKMGIQFQELLTDPNHAYSYPLAIGAAGVRLLDLVSAYGVFATGGIRHEPTAILKITNSKGDILEQWQQDPGVQVLDPQIAYLITSILSDTSVRLSQNMTVPGQIDAAKSGTSNGFIMKDGKKVYFPNDLLTMGYTTKLVAGVWTGNNDPQTDGTISLAADGVTTAAPIWKAFMTQALQGQTQEAFPVPEGIKQVQITKTTGKLPSPLTPPDEITSDIFASFSVPTAIDDSLQQVPIDTLCGGLANEFTPDQMKQNTLYETPEDIASYPDWQQGVLDWVTQNMPKTDPNDSSILTGAPPTTSCPGRSAQNFADRPTISIVTPISNMSFPPGSQIPVQVIVAAPAGIDHVEYALDGNLKYRTIAAPYDGNVRLPVNDPNGTQHTISATIFDKSSFVGTTSINITINSAASPAGTPSGTGTATSTNTATGATASTSAGTSVDAGATTGAGASTGTGAQNTATVTPTGTSAASGGGTVNFDPTAPPADTTANP